MNFYQTDVAAADLCTASSDWRVAKARTSD
jgi:hypothetical protein